MLQCCPTCYVFVLALPFLPFVYFSVGNPSGYSIVFDSLNTACLHCTSNCKC